MTSIPFIPTWSTPSYAMRPFAGDLTVAAAIIAVLLTPFFTKRANAATAVAAFLGFFVAFIFIVAFGGMDVGLQFRGLLVSDPASVLFKALLFLFAAAIVLLWFFSSAQNMHEGDGPEFFTLLLGATLGMSLMASTSNLLMIFLTVELASLPSYVLAGFRKTHRVGAEASLKYVLFGATSTAVLAYGLSLLYGLYGTLDLSVLASRISLPSANSALLVVALFALIAGLGFKIAAVPFHFWCPDVFEGAGIDVAAFLSVASKGAALILLARVLFILPPFHALSIAIGILGALTATVGNTAAFAQNNIKRLLAYSSIAHAGYMLCALSLLTVIQPFILYLTVYFFMNLGAFAVAGLVYRATGQETLEAFAGLGRRAPLAAAAMTACLLSLVGLPPVGGFLAKLNILWALSQAGSGYWVLIAVIVLNTVLSAFYYFRILRAMYFEPASSKAISVHPLGVFLAVLCAGVLLGMFFFFGPLTRLTTHFSHFHDVSNLSQTLSL